MNSEEYKKLNEREKFYFRQGYCLAIKEMDITNIEKETKIFSFDTYLKMLEVKGGY